jgi:hypothetical protein
MKASRFQQFICSALEKLDAKIIAQIRPESHWIGTVGHGDSFDTREAVRKLSEGLAYKPSESPFVTHLKV